jgi:NADH dehydrogenase
MAVEPAGGYHKERWHVERKRVLIVGGGFAGLAAAKGLDRRRFDVTLLDRNNYHLFQPLLYQVATGALSSADIATPLRTILRPPRCRVVQDEVSSIDASGKVLYTASGGSYSWDVLILALGLGHSYFGNDRWAPFAPSLKFLGDAMAIRDRVLGSLEAAERTSDVAARERLLRFVVVGAGPTGVELAGALGELTGRTLAREFSSFDPGQSEILLVEGGPRVLPQYSIGSSERAVEQLAVLGVSVLASTKVVDVDRTGLVLEFESGSRQRLETANVIWAAGAAVTPVGAGIAEQLQVQPEAGGRLPVDENFRLRGRSDVFVIGDLASYELADGPLPGLGPAAGQAGRHVGRYLNGSRKPFEYRERGHLAVIGRNAAVGVIFGREVSGAVAWWAWLLIHIFGLIGLDVKIRVLVVWLWKFFFDKYGARIITGRIGTPAADE